MIAYTEQYLAHHGVKGQKWGVRRYQNEDGSYKEGAEGRYYNYVAVDRKSKKDAIRKARDEYNVAKESHKRATIGGLIVNKESQKRLNDAYSNLRVAKKDYSDAKARERMNNIRGAKSNHRLKLEEKYMQQGMTKEEAEIAAYKRAVTERTIAIAAGVTLAAAAGYAAYRYHDNVTDKILKSGTTLKNVSKFSNKGVEDAFYASVHKSDHDQYVGRYGSALSDRYTNKVYNMTAKVSSDMKIASNKAGYEAAKKLFDNDRVFNANVYREVNSYKRDVIGTSKQKAVLKRASKKLRAGKFDFDVYKAYNMTLADPNQINIDNRKKLYDSLKKSGYSGLMDYNDKYLSGYNSKLPAIIFDSDKIDKTSVKNREIAENIIAEKAMKYHVKDMTKAAGILAGEVIAGAKIVDSLKNKVDSQNDSKIVQEYRKEHPDSKLTYNEILKQHYHK